MKIAFCILLAVVLLGTLSLIVAWLKAIAERDTQLLSGEPIKPPSEAVAQQTTFEDLLEDLLDAIEWVESRGDDSAVGDNGCAVGSFQIHKIYVDDVNRIERIKHIDKYCPPMQYDYQDRESPYLSRYMVNKYLHYYEMHSSNRNYAYCDIECLERMARIHVAGPEGWRNDPEWFVRNRGYSIEHAKDKIANAKAYWAKVKARLEDG